MNTHTARKLLTIMTALACILTANPAHSSVDGARLVGLAMHQEVGRNIYIGAIHYNAQIPVPVDLVGAAGPKTMEYLVVARRTSIRSLMGSILLQGELATGTPPNSNATEFAAELMGAVKGSLYAGDSLTISLDSRNTLSAALNGQHLASSDNRDVADYLLMGWVSERGPSQAFRRSILSENLDSTLMAAYDQHSASPERILAIKSWSSNVDQTDPSSAPTGQTLPEDKEPLLAANQLPIEPSLDTDRDPLPVETPMTGTSEETANSQQGNGEALTTPIDYIANPTAAEQSPAQKPVQLASLTLTREMISSEPDTTETASAIDAIEYTQRLAAFNNHVMRSVYAKIRYPKAAVRRNIEGKLELDLKVAKDGSLLDVAVALTSGNQWLDKSAISAAQAAFSTATLEGIDSVSVAEYGNASGDTLLIPVPISFVLTE